MRQAGPGTQRSCEPEIRGAPAEPTWERFHDAVEDERVKGSNGQDKRSAENVRCLLLGTALTTAVEGPMRLNQAIHSL